MKLKFLTQPLLLVLFIALLSCDDNDDQCNDRIENTIAYVTSVNAPNSGPVNVPMSIEVQFGVINGCGRFEKFIEMENGNSRTIEVEAKYVGSVCTQNVPILTTNYEFTAFNTGNYELNFKSSPTEYITINILIN